MPRANSRESPRNDLPALGDEPRQQAHVLVVDTFDLLGAELADLLAPEVFASAFARPARASARTRTARPTIAAFRPTITAASFRTRIARRGWCFRFFCHSAPSNFQIVFGWRSASALQ